MCRRVSWFVLLWTLCAAGVRASPNACTAANCLHDAVITTGPHTPGNFDLRDDYAQFDAHHQPVITWLQRQAPALQAILAKP